MGVMIVGHCPPKKVLLSVENVPDDNESVVLSAATTMCRQGARKGDTVTGIEKKAGWLQPPFFLASHAFRP